MTEPTGSDDRSEARIVRTGSRGPGGRSPDRHDSDDHSETRTVRTGSRGPGGRSPDRHDSDDHSETKIVRTGLRGSGGRSPGWTVRAELLLGAGGIVLVLAVWQFVAASQMFGTTISPPTDVAEVLGASEQRSVLVDGALVTAREAVVGFVWGLLAALAAGVLVRAVPALRRGVDQLATIESAIPFVALAPILLATVGRESVPTAMAATTAFFSLYIAVVAGLHATPPAVTDVFTVFGASAFQRMVRALIPAGVPVLATGLKVAMPLSIVGAVVGEWFGSSGGLGPIMLVAMRNYRMPMMWSAVVMTVLVAVVLYALAALVERLAAERFG